MKIKCKKIYKKTRTVAYILKAERYEKWYNKHFPPLQPPRMLSNFTMYYQLMCLNYGRSIGAFRRKKISNRYLKRLKIWQEKYGKILDKDSNAELKK